MMRYIATLLCLAGGLAWTLSRPDEIPFEKHALDLACNETCAVADINGDGKLDIVSGENWYEGPRWTKHKFRDHRVHQQLHRRLQRSAARRQWRRPRRHRELLLVRAKRSGGREPRPRRGEWKEHAIETGCSIEFAFLVDLDNDGKAREVLPQFGNAETRRWHGTS